MIPTSYLTRDSYRRAFEDRDALPPRRKALWLRAVWRGGMCLLKRACRSVFR